MAEYGIYDPDDAVGAWHTLIELDNLAIEMRRLGVSTDAIDARRDFLSARPVRIFCYRCRRRVVKSPGLAHQDPPRCNECEREACDLLYCFAEARMAVTLGTTTLMRCEGHALLLWDRLFSKVPHIRPVMIRHLRSKEAY